MMYEYNEETSERGGVQIPILERALTTEVTGDFSLPDYQPEIKRLLRIETNVLPPNRFAGSDGVELQGTLDYYVLYMGHDNGIYCAPFSTEYTMRAEPDAEGRGLLSSVGEPLVCLCDTTAELPAGRVTAPRRLNIRCKIKAAVKLYGELAALSAEGNGGEGHSTEENEVESVERLIRTTEAGRLYWGLGEPIPLQDDVILVPSDGEQRLVCAEGSVLMHEAVATAGAVNCRGEVVLKLTLCPAETESEFASDTVEGRSPRPLNVMQRKIPFSGTVEMAGVTSACTAAASGYCTDISVEMEDGHLHAEMQIVTEARAQKNETVSYVGDLYSTRREGLCKYTTYPAERALRAVNGNFTLSDSLPLAEVGIDASSPVTIADVTATAIPDRLTADRSKGRCHLAGTCRCHLLLLRDGEYSSADMELPFRYEFDEPSLVQAVHTLTAKKSPSDETTLSDGTLVSGGMPVFDVTPVFDGTPIFDVTPVFDGRVSVIHCRARMDGERVGVDAELAVAIRTHLPAPFVAMSDANFGEEVTRRRGEYVICFPAPDDTLWSVAKRYHAPLAALTAANNLPTGADVSSPESLDGAGYLIV
jgi:hypothetical protein